MENTEYTIIIEFRYGIEEDEPFYELSEKMNKRMKKENAPGKYDGHEIAMDNFDARLYFYSFHPQDMLSFIDDILKEYKFLSGGRIHIVHGKHKDAYTEIEIIAPNGTRTPLSRFDAEQLSHIPDWGERGSRHANGEEGEEWKDKIKNERAEKLYNKWKEIDFLIGAIWDKWDLSAPEENIKTKEEKEINIEQISETKNDSSDDEAEKEDYDDDDDFVVPKEMIEWHREEMRRNSMIIPAKISGAEAGDLYIIRMENAAIIRKAAMDINLDCHLLTEAQIADDQDVTLLREEIEQFREYFKEWVAGFELDEFEDEWGLFLQ